MSRSFVSVCTGDKYPDKYVNILYNMVSRHTQNFKFFVITDRHRQINPTIQQVIIKEVFPTWWNKVHLSNPAHPFIGDILYMDLDVVIFRNIDNLWTYNVGQNKLMIIQDFNRCRMEDWKVSNSSVMRFTAGTLHYLWEMYAQNPHAVQGRMHGDQDWITSKGTKDIVWWPRTWIQSYKWELVGKKDTKIKNGAKHVFQHPPTIPDDCSVAVFHGEPKPFNCGDPLVVDNWK